jgi:hypothetical protein
MSHLRAKIRKAKNEERRAAHHIRVDYRKMREAERRVARYERAEAREAPKRLRA